MNVLMMTNTYLPHVGGVARTVATFTEALRERGENVLVVAPTFEHASRHEPGVFRMPAIQHFNGSDFSVRLPVPALLSSALDRFQPEVVHSHHPFLLGDTALRVATRRNLPLVFTHHTMYERYTHYVPMDSPAMKRFAIRLTTQYANLCEHVIAPSESIGRVLRERGVRPPLSAIPTGIDPTRFAAGEGEAARAAHGIPQDAFVVGYVGRLAPEKNLAFLARAVARFLAEVPRARFLVVGAGPSEEEIRSVFQEQGLVDRVHVAGTLQGKPLANAYRAIDAFAFASFTETQGMVLAEAMAAGVPVVAVDGPGTREVVRDGENGRLLPEEDEGAFASALRSLAEAPADRRRAMADAARRTADAFSVDRCTDRLVGLYRQLLSSRPGRRDAEYDAWKQTRRRLETEWNLWASRAQAAFQSIREGRR